MYVRVYRDIHVYVHIYRYNRHTHVYKQAREVSEGQGLDAPSTPIDTRPHHKDARLSQVKAAADHAAERRWVPLCVL